MRVNEHKFCGLLGYTRSVRVLDLVGSIITIRGSGGQLWKRNTISPLVYNVLVVINNMIREIKHRRKSNEAMLCTETQFQKLCKTRKQGSSQKKEITREYKSYNGNQNKYKNKLLM